jgi:hypothetical protein
LDLAVNNSTIARLATWLLILVSALVFAWRGPGRALISASGGVDYAVSYAQGQAWLTGQNAYDLSVCRSIYLHSGAPARLTPLRGYTDSINSPSSFPLFATTAWLPWRWALDAWVTLICGMYILGCILLALSVESRSSIVRTCVLCAGLCFSPILAGIHTGQASVLCVALIVIAIAAAPVLLDRRLLAGLTLGIAISLKPQLALPFLLFFIRKRDWRATFAALTVAAVITTVALVPLLSKTNYAWFDSWINNVRVTSTQGNANDASPANPDSWKLLNLETLLLLAPSSRTVATLISVALVAGGVVLWWKRSGHSAQDDVSIRYVMLLALSALVLLPVYHRNYDAGVLVFGIAAIPLLWRTQRSHTIILAILLAPFMVPLPAILATHLGHGLHASDPKALIKLLLLRHEVLLLVAIVVVALRALKNTAVSEKPAPLAMTPCIQH